MAEHLTFNSRSEFRAWLKKIADETGSSDAYHEWLLKFLDDGNTFSVRDKELNETAGNQGE